MITNIDKIIIDIKYKYFNKLSKIKTNYINNLKTYNLDIFRKCMYYQEKVIINIIKDVVDNFKELQDCSFIALNGSYARGTNIYISDIDLNIFYEDKYKKKLFKIELQTNYILSRILDFRGCDRIHTIMVYTPLVSNYINYCYENGYLSFDEHKIKYFFREGYERLIYETFNTSRDYKKLVKHFKNLIINNHICNEWMNNFILIKDNYCYKNFRKDIKNIFIINQRKLKNSIMKEIDLLLEKIKNYDVGMSEDIIEIKILKKIYKTMPMDIMYKYLAIISKIYDIDSVNIKHYIKIKF